MFVYVVHILADVSVEFGILPSTVKNPAQPSILALTALGPVVKTNYSTLKYVEQCAGKS